MTITVTGDDDILEQIEKQLAKLIDVKEIVELPHDESVCRELVLIKVLCTREERQQITTMADIYRANIVDVAKILDYFAYRKPEQDRFIYRIT